MIRIEGLSKQFTTSSEVVDVLRDIDLAVPAGDRVAVVGASGAGKTTFLHLLGGLDCPSSGRVSIDGEDIYTLQGQALDRFRNRKVGFVFQFHQLLPEFSALENVMMPALIGGAGRDEASQRARELLAQVSLDHRFDHRPGQLSGGEQQRVAIARALMQSPRLLLADEPTGNLDSRTSRGIFDLLDKLHVEHGLTMVVVTHNEEFAGRLDRMLHMRDGRLEA
ncbi:MAG: lipoprotein-releasing system ATP-binding protein LolD [Desulfuromonas sp.]|nr:MAG: lipoprotein-releasing system ATP-binding protein LolD [Desulfuromonas sp.]